MLIEFLFFNKACTMSKIMNFAFLPENLIIILEKKIKSNLQQDFLENTTRDFRKCWKNSSSHKLRIPMIIRSEINPTDFVEHLNKILTP